MYITGTMPLFITTGDLNNDKKLDLAITNAYDNTISLLFGIGNGMFESQITFETGLSSSFLLANDFDNDMKLGLAVVHMNAAEFSIFLNDCR